MNRWKYYSIETINEVLSDEDIPWEKKLKAISKAYPFGPKQYFPYKIWLQEVQRAKIAIQKRYKDITLVSLPKKTWTYRCNGCGEKFQVSKKIKTDYCPKCVGQQFLF